MYLEGIHQSGSDSKESPGNAGNLVRFPGQEDPWRREWQHTPICLLKEFHGQRNLVGYSPWGHNVRHN